jgi:hypothetical protein
MSKEESTLEAIIRHWIYEEEKKRSKSREEKETIAT